jgi:hypothetical protein
MSIDLGNSPTPPNANPDSEQSAQIRNALNCFSRGGDTMDQYANIGWYNASAIREAGEQGLEIECSVGYRWQWVAGRMILRKVNTNQIAKLISIDGTSPTATDDITKGFIQGSRWEIDNGTVYICTDATQEAAVWNLEGDTYYYVNQNGEQLDPNIINTAYDQSVTLFNQEFDGTLQPNVTLLYAGEYNALAAYTIDGVDPSSGFSGDYLYYGGMPEAVNSEYLVVGVVYKIEQQGTNTDWLEVGATGAEGEIFTATGSTTGDGVARELDYVYLRMNGYDYTAVNPFSSLGDINMGPQNYYELDWQPVISAANVPEFEWPISLDFPSEKPSQLLIVDDSNNNSQYKQIYLSTGNTQPPYWIRIPEFEGNLPIVNGTSGTLPINRGGTNATSLIDAVNSVGGYIYQNLPSAPIGNGYRNTIISCSGTATLTIQLNLDANFNCRVLRYGTGDVTIAGVAGVTILSHNNHKKIHAQYDMITITRVAANTYVLSGSLKA